MKRILSIIVVSLAFASCYDPNYVQTQPVVVQQPQYQVITDPYTGAQQVMFYDGTQQMLMDYVLFNQLMGNGGYNNVITYYHRTPSIRRVYEPSRYNSWKRSSAPSSWGSSSGYSSKNYDNSSARTSGWEIKSSAKSVSVSPATTSGYSSSKSQSYTSPAKSSGYSSFKSVSSSPTKTSGYSSFKSSSSSSSSRSSGYSSGKRRN